MPDEGLIVEARGENLLAVRFTAMASPCEVLLPLMGHSRSLGDRHARGAGSLARREEVQPLPRRQRHRLDP